jgi:cbb3-type cytochrome oxidase subunit 3
VLVLGSLLFGIVVTAGSVAVYRRRNREELDQQAQLAFALDEVLSDSLDDLRAERDPRKAVIRAYARMEKTFGAYGVPREEHETPLEYVARVLDSLRVSSFAVRRLVQLFERAKFSPHTIEGSMKDDAIEALAGLRAELEQGSLEAA